MNAILKINKEEISGLKFPELEVLHSREEIVRRKMDLERAMVLGNTEHIKTQICFETRDGMKAVETTVWAATETEVNLKGGVCIPLRSIFRVRI